MSLEGKKVVVGLTGGIACYKIPYLVRSLTGAGAEVKVIMTEAACKFITPLTMETVSGHPVAVELFPENKFIATRHIDLAQWPDVIIVAPATANFLGKTASGISDDLLTTVVCASARPVIIVPAMNPQMWHNRVTQRNYAFLKELGYHFIDPDEGDTACGDLGVGRMAEPAKIFEFIRSFLGKAAKKKVLTGKKILVTAGPTREEIDPVRYITNRSSGKMGFALAEAARELGADTTLISGPVTLPPPEGVRFIAVETTAQLDEAVKKEFKKADILIMAAAPSDYTPVEKVLEKIKKDKKNIQIAFTGTPDILKDIGRMKKKHQRVVGFALETENALGNARKKLKEKNLDLIVLNNIRDKGAGFGYDTNKVTLLIPGRKPVVWPLMTKLEISFKLLEILTGLF
jgi:phosphopantothenoylcysteine decarboxylase/phosphopantothenate--cysteine ligase